jgi:hypothetical protein
MILALALASATPLDQPGLVVPQPVRYEFVFETAKRVCPALYVSAKNQQDLNTLVDRVTERLGFSSHESILLIDFCILYSDGVTQR